MIFIWPFSAELHTCQVYFIKLFSMGSWESGDHITFENIVEYIGLLNILNIFWTSKYILA